MTLCSFCFEVLLPFEAYVCNVCRQASAYESFRGRRLYYASLEDYDTCSCTDLSDHAAKWPQCKIGKPDQPDDVNDHQEVTRVRAIIRELEKS